ncbi:Flp family type IVb pilin [Acidisphaera sp. L21]|nr:hypothetical protein [Acidisphaera sp. L21]
MTAIEYAMIAGTAGIAALGGATLIGTSLRSIFTKLGSAFH